MKRSPFRVVSRIENEGELISFQVVNWTYFYITVSVYLYIKTRGIHVCVIFHQVVYVLYTITSYMCYITSSHICVILHQVMYVLYYIKSYMCYILSSHICVIFHQVIYVLHFIKSYMCYIPSSHICVILHQVIYVL